MHGRSAGTPRTAEIRPPSLPAPAHALAAERPGTAGQRQALHGVVPDCADDATGDGCGTAGRGCHTSTEAGSRLIAAGGKPHGDVSAPAPDLPGRRGIMTIRLGVPSAIRRPGMRQGAYL